MMKDELKKGNSSTRRLSARVKRRVPRQAQSSPRRRNGFLRRWRWCLVLLERFERAPAWQWGRLLLVWFVLVGGGLGLGWNLYQLQIVRSPELTNRARQQQMVYMRPYVPRRPIIDRQGNVLATDRLVYTLYAHPKLFKIPKAEMVDKLSEVLNPSDSEDLLEKFNRSESGIPIVRAMDEEIADKIVALNADGLELIRRYSRFYPQQDLVSDAIGYVDLDHKGQAGLEYSQQKFLERHILSLRLNRAGNGALMPDRVQEGFLDVDDKQLQLTLDLRVQRAARFILKQQIEQFNAKRGTVIVMDARDGALLSIACEPTYDPNQYYNSDLNLFKNWAVTDLYEPGSTFKPINIAIALENGAIQPDSTFQDSGVLYIDTWEIKNHDFDTQGARGTLDLHEILQYSSNVGMVKIIRQMSQGNYYKALKRLKLNKQTGIELPGEAVGQLKSEKKFKSSPVEAATTAFGQGFSLTPIKLVQLHAALANGGKLVTPHVVRGLMDAEGKNIAQPNLKSPSRIFSPETTQTVLSMMESAIEADSGRNARIDSYRIAGKSGTAQKASPAGGYYSHLKISSFVGIFPVEDPRYVVLAVVDEPKGENAYGSTVAAPIVKAVMEALISIEGIPPSSDREP